MWARLASLASGLALRGLALCLAGGIAHAQSAKESASGLETCFEVARVADAICSNMRNDPTERVNCFTKARATQLECLDRVLSEAPARTVAPGGSFETARPAPPKAASERTDSQEAGRTDKPAVSIGAAPADEAARRSSSLPKSAPPSLPPAVAEAPTATILSDDSGKKSERPARETDWILSETTSPIDYSPLTTAVIRPTSDVSGGPNMLAVRCRAQHTELSIRTDGAWAVRRGNGLLVDYQIDDQPVVQEPWMLSADGKTATYKNDPVELLRSIPEGATLKIAVTDKGNVRREATFALRGLSGIRKEVGTTCKWLPVTANTSSDKR
jgi:hypothetical protein